MSTIILGEPFRSYTVWATHFDIVQFQKLLNLGTVSTLKQIIICELSLA